MPRQASFLLLGLLAVAGCATKQKLSAAQYVEEANGSFREGSLALAITEYKELLDQHPFSEYNEEAEIRIAHAQYLDGSYPEAVVALTDFQRRHPTSPHLAFVGYLLGMCYVQQINSIDRDQTAAQNAQSYFMTVSQQFPSSPYADLARLQLSRCRENLAAHEMYVANYYEGQGNRTAAQIRLLDLATRYGETPQCAVALLKLGEMYETEDRKQEAELALRAVSQMHPRSDEAAVAKKDLAQIGSQSDAAGRDPLDALLALNGRERGTNYEAVPVPVPGLEPSSRGTRAPSAAPGMGMPGIGAGGAGGAGFDPFGRGRGGRAY